MNVKKVLEKIYSKSLKMGDSRVKTCNTYLQVPEKDYFFCRDCTQYHEICMVEDYIWKQIVGKQKEDITLCFPCMERRLGRKLTLKDLQHVSSNAPYFIGFQMERF